MHEQVQHPAGLWAQSKQTPGSAGPTHSRDRPNRNLRRGNALAQFLRKGD
jgi:hypothetical protein